MLEAILHPSLAQEITNAKALADTHLGTAFSEGKPSPTASTTPQAWETAGRDTLSRADAKKLLHVHRSIHAAVRGLERKERSLATLGRVHELSAKHQEATRDIAALLKAFRGHALYKEATVKEAVAGAKGHGTRQALADANFLALRKTGLFLYENRAVSIPLLVASVAVKFGLFMLAAKALSNVFPDKAKRAAQGALAGGAPAALETSSLGAAAPASPAAPAYAAPAVSSAYGTPAYGAPAYGAPIAYAAPPTPYAYAASA